MLETLPSLLIFGGGATAEKSRGGRYPVAGGRSTHNSIVLKSYTGVFNFCKTTGCVTGVSVGVGLAAGLLLCCNCAIALQQVSIRTTNEIIFIAGFCLIVNDLISAGCR